MRTVTVILTVDERDANLLLLWGADIALSRSTALPSELVFVDAETVIVGSLPDPDELVPVCNEPVVGIDPPDGSVIVAFCSKAKFNGSCSRHGVGATRMIKASELR